MLHRCLIRFCNANNAAAAGKAAAATAVPSDCIFADHAAAYEKVTSAVSTIGACAVYTGAPYPAHVQKLLLEHASSCGFKSPYWISSGQLRRRNIPLKENQKPIMLCLEGPEREVFALNVGALPNDEVTLFLQETSIPVEARDTTNSANYSKAFIYREGKFRAVTDSDSLRRLHALRSQHQYPLGLWMEAEEARAAGLSLPTNVQPESNSTLEVANVPAATNSFSTKAPPSMTPPMTGTVPMVKIVEGSRSALYNVEQTQVPVDRFTPTYATAMNIVAQQQQLQRTNDDGDVDRFAL